MEALNSVHILGKLSHGPTGGLVRLFIGGAASACSRELENLLLSPLLDLNESSTGFASSLVYETYYLMQYHLDASCVHVTSEERLSRCKTLPFVLENSYEI